MRTCEECGREAITKYQENCAHCGAFLPNIIEEHRVAEDSASPRSFYVESIVVKTIRSWPRWLRWGVGYAMVLIIVVIVDTLFPGEELWFYQLGFHWPLILFWELEIGHLMLLMIFRVFPILQAFLVGAMMGRILTIIEKDHPTTERSILAILVSLALYGFLWIYMFEKVRW